MTEDEFIEYPVADRILRTILPRILKPKRVRPQGATIISVSNNGKTYILNKIITIISDLDSPTGRVNKIHHIIIEAPPSGSPKGLLQGFERILSIPTISTGSIDRHYTYVIDVLNDIKPDVIFVDELNNIVAATKANARIILDILKSISNELGIPIIAAGTYAVMDVLRKDEQYMSRFEPLSIPLWEYDQSYLGLLQSLEVLMKLEQGSLTSPSISSIIYEHSKQRIGRVVEHVESAIKLANETSSAITEDILIQTIPPEFTDLHHA